MKTVKISVNGKPYIVEVGDVSASPISVVVNGKSYAVELEKEAAPQRAAGTSPTPAPAPTASTPSPAPAPAAVAAAPGNVIAPMPGKILEVKVAVGDRVSHGTELVVLEAMKMQNVVRAQGAGVVKEIRVTPGQSVSFGAVLVVIE